jgi:L-threonylcarbamoyladenylate synthase
VRIKQRDEKKSLISLMHPDFIQEYVDIDLQDLLDKYKLQTVPTTFILPNPKNIPKEMTKDAKIAVRIPWHCDYLMQALKVFGKPIISTSANLA